MATCTRRELVEQAAAKLGAKAAGQALAIEDYDTINQYLDALLDQLGEDDILLVGDDDAIPASWCPFLAILLSNLAAYEYGGQFDANVKASMEAILRRLVRAKETFEVQQTDYF